MAFPAWLLVGPSVGWPVLVGLLDLSVCHNFLKGRQVTLPRSYRGTFLSKVLPLPENILFKVKSQVLRLGK